MDDRGVVDLGLLTASCALERVQAEERGEPFKTIRPIGGRSLSKGTTSPPFFVDLGLVGPFLPGAERFVIFTFCSQPER